MSAHTGSPRAFDPVAPPGSLACDSCRPPKNHKQRSTSAAAQGAKAGCHQLCPALLWLRLLLPGGRSRKASCMQQGMQSAWQAAQQHARGLSCRSGWQYSSAFTVHVRLETKSWEKGLQDIAQTQKKTAVGKAEPGFKRRGWLSVYHLSHHTSASFVWLTCKSTKVKEACLNFEGHVSTRVVLLTCSSLDWRMVPAGAAVSLLLILLTHMLCMTGALWGSVHLPTPSVTAATKLEGCMQQS